MAKPKGRKPKPTKLKVVQGNPGRRPLNKKEADVKSDTLKCPSWIKGEGRLEWKRMTEELAELGLLGSIDHAHLEMYCSSYGRMVEIEKKLSSLGDVTQKVLQKTINNNVIMNVLYCSLNKEKLLIHKLATEFGMTPSSRSRIPVEPPPKESEFAKFLNAKKEKK